MSSTKNAKKSVKSTKSRKPAQAKAAKHATERRTTASSASKAKAAASVRGKASGKKAAARPPARTVRAAAKAASRGAAKKTTAAHKTAAAAKPATTRNKAAATTTSKATKLSTKSKATAAKAAAAKAAATKAAALKAKAVATKSAPAKPAATVGAAKVASVKAAMTPKVVAAPVAQAAIAQVAAAIPAVTAAAAAAATLDGVKTAAAKVGASVKETVERAVTAIVPPPKVANPTPVPPQSASAQPNTAGQPTPMTSEKAPSTLTNSQTAPASQAPMHHGRGMPMRPNMRPGLVIRPPRPTGIKVSFKPNEYVVYPAHGVGQIIAVEEQEVAGFKLELFVISFIKDKMILKVPTPKVASVGMRKLAETPVVEKALTTLTGRARIKRTMWSRRAQEYEAKINSGDLGAIAEVVRDLYRSEAQPEQSYSERQLFEAAIDRMGREIAVVRKLTEQEAFKLIEGQLQKGPRRGPAKEEDGVDASEADTDVEEAA